jgi:hypothetical protein
VEIDDDGRSGPGWAIFVRGHEDLRFRLDVMHVPLRLSQDGGLQRGRGAAVLAGRSAQAFR